MTPDLNMTQTIAISSTITAATLLILIMLLVFLTWEHQIRNFLQH